MARIRTIKPEFWTDEAITECSLSARLLFIGMWNFADDRGNIERSAKQMKMKIFPADDIDCEPLVGELMRHNFLVEYEVDGKKYLHIRTFKDHQIINRPSKTGLPEYDETMRAHATLTEDSLTEGKGREGKGREGKGKEVKEENLTPPPQDRMTPSEAAKLLRDYSGQLIIGGGDWTVLQDICKTYAPEKIKESFQVAAASRPSKFLPYLLTVLKGTGNQASPYDDDNEFMRQVKAERAQNGA